MRISTLLGVGLLACWSSGASADPQLVRLIMPSHIPQTTQRETVYAGRCEDVSYRLTVTPEKKAVVFSAEGMPDADISGTTVGARLLEEDVLVEVGFNCPYQAINIFLKGVKLVDLGTPVGFRDVITVRANGEVSKSLPRDERLEALAIPRPTQ